MEQTSLIKENSLGLTATHIQNAPRRSRRCILAGFLMAF